MAGKTASFPSAEAFKIPGVNVEMIVAYHQRNLDAFQRANQAAVKGFQAIAERQSEFFRSAIDGATKATEALVSAKTPEEKMRKQAELAKDGVVAAMTEAQEIAGLVTAATTEAAGVINARVAESFDEVRKIFANGHAA